MLLIMACSEKKNEGEQASVVKYDTRQHEAALKFMWEEGFAAGWEFVILSAKHGFVAATEAVEDYNQKLCPKRAAELQAHEAPVADMLSENHEHVYVYGGAEYRNLVQKLFPMSIVTEMVGPNRGCGDHFSALQDIFNEGPIL